jgi:hypothetical protein
VPTNRRCGLAEFKKRALTVRSSCHPPVDAEFKRCAAENTAQALEPDSSLLTEIRQVEASQLGVSIVTARFS